MYASLSAAAGDGRQSLRALLPYDTIVSNERMRAMLFDTEKFPTATATSMVDPAILEAVAERTALMGVAESYTLRSIAVDEE